MHRILKRKTCTRMKKLCFILILALPLLFAACKAQQPDTPWPRPDYYGWGIYPGSLQMNHTRLDTVTPPSNPLHPMPSEVAELPTYYGYLDCARYVDNKRYCALIGMGEGRNVYYLTDDMWKPIRYDSPLLAGCHVGEILYVRGYLTTDKSESVLLLMTLDVERTDSILPAEYALRR